MPLGPQGDAFKEVGIMRTLLIALALVFAVSSIAFSAVWEVPSGTLTTIQAGIDTAAAGDTVLVLPGSYYENLVMKDGVVLLGRDGWGATTLRPETDGPPVIDCTDLGPGTVIEGFLIRDGRSHRGGGILCTRSGPVIVLNGFILNYADSAGGAIACVEGSDAAIDGNTFIMNESDDLGGAILCDASGPAITGNSFSESYSRYGGAISCVMGADPLIAENEFLKNRCGMQGAAVHTRYGCVLTIEDNVFLDNFAAGSGGALFVQFESYAEIRRNVLAWNEADHGGGMHITGYASALIEDNTLYRNKGTDIPGASGISAYNNSTVEVYRCIVSSGLGRPGIVCEFSSSATLDCNCVWGNPVDYHGCAPGPRDFSECPSFCYVDMRNFYLCDGSPCAPGNHPNGFDCGLIGALGVGCGCGPTATEQTSWGAIKAMYR
jgi:hypothetical protein